MYVFALMHNDVAARIERAVELSTKHAPYLKMMISLPLRNTEHPLPTTAAGPQRLTPTRRYHGCRQKKCRAQSVPICACPSFGLMVYSAGGGGEF